VTERAGLLSIWPLIAIASAGVIVGTFTGMRLLRHVPESLFRPVVAMLLLALGVWMLAGG
jgi:uncharacterized membrane protein YfcA